MIFYGASFRAAFALRPSETLAPHGSFEAPLDNKVSSKGSCSGGRLKGTTSL